MHASITSMMKMEKKETIDSLITGKNKDTWNYSLSNEWDHLAKGNNRGMKGTETIAFISKSDVPSNKKSYIHDDGIQP